MEHCVTAYLSSDSSTSSRWLYDDRTDSRPPNTIQENPRPRLEFIIHPKNPPRVSRIAGASLLAIGLSFTLATPGPSQAEETQRSPADSASAEFGKTSRSSFTGTHIIQLRKNNTKKTKRILASAKVTVPRSERASLRGPVFNGITADLTRSEVKRLRNTRGVKTVLKNKKVKASTLGNRPAEGQKGAQSSAAGN
jgi:hypothetical protein